MKVDILMQLVKGAGFESRWLQESAQKVELSAHVGRRFRSNRRRFKFAPVDTFEPHFIPISSHA